MAKDLLYIHPRIYETAIKSGINALNTHTIYHPITTTGALLWGEIVGTFRRTVIKNNVTWRTEFRNGLSLLVNVDMNCTIVVSSGNAATGLAETHPCTQNTKGSATYNYVGHNYELWDISDKNCEDTHKTYIFLYHLDRNKNEIRYELGMPMQARICGRRGKIQIHRWQSRVIFEPIATHVGESQEDYQQRVLMPKLKPSLRYRGALRDLNL